MWTKEQECEKVIREAWKFIDGVWQTNEHKIATLFCDYFKSIFSSSDSQQMERILNDMFPTKAPRCDENQSAFVPNLMILDHMMAAFETMHTIKGVKKGQDVKVALKLDMTKPYDRMEALLLDTSLYNMGYGKVVLYGKKEEMIWLGLKW
ncbi:unnamed protein product [Prunus armeniaca]